MEEKIYLMKDFERELLLSANKEKSKCPMPHSERVSCNQAAYYTVQGTMLCQYHAAQAMKDIVNLRKVAKYQAMGFSQEFINQDVWGVK